MTQRQNECASSTDLWFERESITNAPLQSPNSHLLPQYFFCWIRYVMEEVRRNLSWKRQPYLVWFGLIPAKRKQTMEILKMPPFCRLRLLTRDEHAHSFCRCVHHDNSFIAHARIHELKMRKVTYYLRFHKVHRTDCKDKIPCLYSGILQSLSFTGWTLLIHGLRFRFLPLSLSILSLLSTYSTNTWICSVLQNLPIVFLKSSWPRNFPPK